MNTNTFFHWLYEPNIYENFIINDIINIAKNLEIPDILILIKYVKYIMNSNPNLTKDDIVNHIIQFKICEDYNIEEIEKVISYAFWIPNHNCDNILELKQKINSFVNKNFKVPNNNNNKVKHSGYPLPNPIYGRPKLDMLKCHHKNCNQSFIYIQNLKEHLIENGVYTHGLHAAHDFYIGNSYLTPEKVIEKNMTRCPAFICNKSHIIMTPQELCEHFAQLGIKPFWKPGINFDNNDDDDDDNNKNKELKLNTDGKIYYDDTTCLICYNQEISTIFLPCLHYYTCIDCANQIGDKCPICKTNIDNKIMY
jgi:hypothetical protein